MSREAVYHGIILKKQPLNEADEIITFFTQEAGKVRGMAKSVKLAKSKLQNALQGLFYVRLVLAQSSGSGTLSKIIRTEVLETFMGLRENFLAVQAGLFAAEAVYKATPDEHKNSKLFNLLLEFLRSISRGAQSGQAVYNLVAKFEIGFLESLGFGLRLPKDASRTGQVLYLTSQGGGFVWAAKENDRIKVDEGVYEAFLKLRANDFVWVAGKEIEFSRELGLLLVGFIEYHLERKLYTHKLFL